MNNLFKMSGKELDGVKTYVVNFNGKDFEFIYQEYDNAYVCLEDWDKSVEELNKYLKNKGVKTKVDVTPRKNYYYF